MPVGSLLPAPHPPPRRRRRPPPPPPRSLPSREGRSRRCANERARAVQLHKEESELPFSVLPILRRVSFPLLVAEGR